MYIRRGIDAKMIFLQSWQFFLSALLWAILVYCLYDFSPDMFPNIPFELVTVIGIAVSFLIGFKNSQSYDRFWEGRKIWGMIVNFSRTWTNQVLNLIGTGEIGPENQEIRKELVYRHIAWLHALRIQLRRPTTFSPNENILVEKLLDTPTEEDGLFETIAPYLCEADMADLKDRKNVATHLIKLQGKSLRALHTKLELTSGFDNLMLMNSLEKFYDFQGMCERIKNTPFPRQYSYFSRLFTRIFVLVLPFGLIKIMLGRFIEREVRIPTYEVSLFVFFAVLIGWIFLVWDNIGSDTEDPFESRMNDVPMSALTRTIEIDLRDMLDESKLPGPLKPKENILN